MKDTISVKEAALRWGLSERRVSILCKEGRIPGVGKVGRSWRIPADAKKPTDARVKTGLYQKKEKLALPIGISDYRLASTEYYYIDKTMMIKEFLDERPMVSLFTRPRRFGKTLNMDMLRTFFEKTQEDTSVYFQDKKIWSCGERYRSYQGKYPVIFITFKDVKCKTWEKTLEHIAKILQAEFARHGELENSGLCAEYEKVYFKSIVNGLAGEVDLTRALLELSKMLHAHHGVAPIIIIDEYDTPIQQGYMQGFYDQVILFMRNLFSGGLKDNKHLSYGFLTGILRVAKESIFSGLNNLKLNSILDNRYSEYFGFTTEEVKEMCEYFGASEKFEEICSWYDGYRFGKTEIFNPWSVINYFGNECEPRAFWQATGNNEIIGEVLEYASEDLYDRLAALVQGKSFLTYIDTGVIYPQIKSNPSSVYSFLLVAGYLKVLKSSLSASGDYFCEVCLPNKEIEFVYNKEILAKLENVIPKASVIALQEALYLERADILETQLRKLLLQSVSSFDAVGENFYHGLLLGLCTMLDDRYEVTSNREAGEGRYDIQLLPKNNRLPGVLIEIKYRKGCTSEELKSLSETALKQIVEKQYDTELKGKGVKKILKYGIAFSGKKIELAYEAEE